MDKSAQTGEGITPRINRQENIGISQEKLVSSRIFTYNGMEIMEQVCKWDTAGKEHYKLFWIRMPMSSLQLDGKNSPFFHHDFYVEGMEEVSRRRVKEIFDEYWLGGKKGTKT